MIVTIVEGIASIVNTWKKSNRDEHFLEEANHSIEDFDVQITVQLDNIPRVKDQARKRRK